MLDWQGEEGRGLEDEKRSSLEDLIHTIDRDGLREAKSNGSQQ